MEKSYLYRRHNVYWVRVRVPDKVRDIVGKTQLSKNLSTTDLSEANRKKHIVIAELKQIIHFAEKKIDGNFASLSKEDQIRELALEFRPSSNLKIIQKISIPFLLILSKIKYQNYMEKKNLMQFLIVIIQNGKEKIRILKLLRPLRMHLG